MGIRFSFAVVTSLQYSSSLQCYLSEMPEFVTGGLKKWKILPLKGDQDQVNFAVRCSHDAHLALLCGEDATSPAVTIAIGCWMNTKSVVLYKDTLPNKVEAFTPLIVCPLSFRRFWVSFKDNVIQVGKYNINADENLPFLTWKIPCEENQVKYTHFAFTTGWGACGGWIFYDQEDKPKNVEEEKDFTGSVSQICYHQPAYWQNANDVMMNGKKIPPSAVVAGIDPNGNKIYVGRVDYQGKGIFPGQIEKRGNEYFCFIATDRTEHSINTYQIMMKTKGSDLDWVEASDGQIPNGALQGGVEANGDPVFIARVAVEGSSASIGGVYPRRGVCCVAYKGKKLLENRLYEVLVFKQMPLVRSNTRTC